MIDLNGGRGQVRTADPYDVNVGIPTETAVFCGNRSVVFGKSGRLCPMRSRRLVQLAHQPLRYSPRSPGAGG